MKVKLGAIVDAMPAISQIANRPWPNARGAYRVGKLVRKMNSAYQQHLRDRDALAKRLGEPEKGNPTKLNIKDTAAFEKQLEAMRERFVTLEGCARIPWSDLDALNPSPSPAVMADIEEFIEAIPAERKAA